MMEERLRKAKLMKPLIANGCHRMVLFSNEKPIAKEEDSNPQVVVWGGISATGKTKSVFNQRGVKINAEVYTENVLENVLFPRV